LILIIKCYEIIKYYEKKSEVKKFNMWEKNQNQDNKSDKKLDKSMLNSIFKHINIK